MDSFGYSLVPDSPMMEAPPPGIDQVSGALNMPAFGEGFAKATFDDSLTQLALWYIDIKGFRAINPKFGFMTGNAVLRSLSDSIREILCGDLPITRLGGDRFVFLTAGIDLDQAQEKFSQLVDVVNDKTSALGVNIRLMLAGGVYYLREPDLKSHDFRRALDYTSIAHRNAQGTAKSALFDFTDEDLERDMRRIAIEQSIDQALVEHQIEVWYQPQVDYSYGEIVGAEALARWEHPELGSISPVEFIPVLENCGKIHELDLYVWEEACRAAGRWRSKADGKPVPISVNISRAEMFEDDLVDCFKRLQRKYSLPEGSLHLEITERAFVEDAERLSDVLENMRSSSIVVEMDDFGTGMASLHMLKDAPVDVVKLDVSLVQSGTNDPRGSVVLASVIRMLQGLNMPIIAEGVETLEQAELLKNLGCRMMQGFHFSRPLPVQEFEAFIGANTAADSFKPAQSIESRVEQLMSFDAQTSFLFNHAIGGMLFFYVNNNKEIESIIANDMFYEECGLQRSDFGYGRVGLMDEIDPDSRPTLYRAVAESRENGSAMCMAKVQKSGRWFEGCMRYLGEGDRGMIMSLTICRSGDVVDPRRAFFQAAQDINWNLEMVDKIIPSGFTKCALDDKMTIDFIMPQLVDALGFRYRDFMQRYHNSFIEVIAPAERSKVLEAVNHAAQTDGLMDCQTIVCKNHGKLARANLIGRIAQDFADTKLFYVIVMIKDEIGEADYEEADLRLGRTIHFDYHVDTGELVVDLPQPDGTVRETRFSDWLEKVDTMGNIIDPISSAKALAMVRDLRHHPSAGFTDLKVNLRDDGALRWYHINYTCDADENGDTTVIHGYAQDANDKMGSAKWWREQAEIDQLTGLLNRNSAEQQINLHMRTDNGGMMFMLDLDDFKVVNDGMGHLVGDDLLRDVSDVLLKHFREGDVLGRYGGDEFMAFVPLPLYGNPHDLALRRAADVIRDISQIQFPDGTHAGCSVGVAVSFSREHSFYDLLEVADQALYESKAAGKGTCTIKDM